MDRKSLSIHPLDLGSLLLFDKSIFTLVRNQGIKLDFPCIAWVILGGEKPVLVDTGPCDPDWASKYHRTLKKTSSQDIKKALHEFGLSPKDIGMVIFTHLHWDHCFNVDHFSEATFVVQRSEMEYAVSPLPSDKKAYEVGIPGVQPPWMKVFGNIRLIDGDQEILPGIQVLHLPGHTPGSQGVVVHTLDGPWVIAGDNVPLYENWEGDGTLDHIPSGVYQNLFDYFNSFEKLEKYCNKILPSHDQKVFLHSEYPNR